MQKFPQGIVVLGTGGTIAGTAASAADHTGYTAAQLGVAALVGPLAEGDPTLEAEQVLQLDSKDMGHAEWQALARRAAHHLARPEVAALVITHGTDTLEETAYFLHRVLAPAKPVVLTAAMRPATALQADGPQNLRDALAVARWPGAVGVVAVVAGQVIGAPDLRKQHTYRIDAFDAGDAGPVAVVEEGRLRVFRPWPAGRAAPGAAQALALDPATWPWVAVLTSHAGVQGRMVEALCQAGVRGVVVAGTGNGTLHRDLEAALHAARGAGVAVLRSTRCARGALVGAGAALGEPGRVSAAPAGAGFDGAGSLSPVQARIELMLGLMAP